MATTADGEETAVVGSEVTIRRSRPDDVDAFVAVYEEVAAEGRWIGGEAPTDPARTRTSFARNLDADDAATFLAEVDGSVVGVLGVRAEAGVAELGMMVRDGFRGRGIGAALLHACIDWARTAGAHKVALQVWPHNERAIVLYERAGFVLEGRLARHWRRRNGELWDALVMGLVLDTTSPGSPYPDAR